MGGSRDRRKGSGDWDPEEWPGTEWDQGEPPAREDAVREREGAPERDESGSQIRADIRSVMDDPLYEPRPGDRALRASRSDGGKSPPRLHARPARTGLSFGQKFLLWIGFAFVSAISFAAGLIVGAGGGLDVRWLERLAPGGAERPAAVEMDDPGTPLDPEGVIRFGDRGTVPSETGLEGAVLKSASPGAPEGEPPAPAGRKAAAPEAAGTAEPAKATPKQAPKVTRTAVAPAKPAAPAAAKTDPEPPAAEDPAAEMTFYETSTGKAAMPGLADARDAEAPPDPEPAAEQAPAKPAPAEKPAVAEADVPDAPEPAVAAAKTDPEPAPEPATAPEPAPEPAPVEADTGPPSGAEMLARRLAGEGAKPASGAPASSTAASGETYTVQVTTLADENEARRLVERLKSRGFDARVIPLSRAGLGTLYRIRVGRYPSEESARSDLNRLAAEPGAHPYIRME